MSRKNRVAQGESKTVLMDKLPFARELWKGLHLILKTAAAFPRASVYLLHSCLRTCEIT